MLRPLILVLMVLTAGTARAYQVNCGTTPASPGPAQVTSISSVFGEARTSSAPGFRFRFHTGVDIPTQCPNTKNVYALKAGTVQYVPECTSVDQCRRVLAADGTTFDYIHLDPATVVAVNTTVAVNDTIGTVQSGPLHLAETYTIGGTRYAINPQRQGALDFIDADTTEFKTITIGGVTDSVIPIVESGLGNDGQQTSTQPFTYRGNVYYGTGQADIIVTASGKPGTCGSSCRKGLFIMGYEILGGGFPLRLIQSGWSNIAMWTIYDDQSRAKEGTDMVFFNQNSSSISDFATNMKLSGNPAQQAIDSTWDTTQTPEGAARICGRIKNYPSGSERINCVDGYVDRSGPTITMSNAGGTVADGGATSTATITVQGVDPGGIYSIKVAKSDVSYSSTNYVSGVQTTASNTFPDSPNTLIDGTYNVTVVDLAGNQASGIMVVRTSPPSVSGKNAHRDTLPPNPAHFGSSNTLAGFCEDPSGISSISVDGSATSFSCDPVRVTTSAYSPFYQVAPGAHSVTCTNCAGLSATKNFSVDIGTHYFTLKYDGNEGTQQFFDPAAPKHTTLKISATPCGTLEHFCQSLTLTPRDYCHYTGSAHETGFSLPTPQDKDFTVSSSTDPPYQCATTITATVPDAPGSVNLTLTPPNNGEKKYGHIILSEFQQNASTGPPAGPCTASAPPNFITMVACDIGNYFPATQRLVRMLVPGAACCLHGSDLIFNSSSTVSFSFQAPTGINFSTTTLTLYQYDGVNWSTATVPNHYVTEDSSGVVTASATLQQTGTFAAFFQAPDSSAPLTSIWFQTTSSFSFDRTLFVSTDAFAVLVATDPVVSGYASTVATTYFRLDAATPTASYSIYSSSIPLSIGLHALEYYSVDWAGNQEAVRISTFLVTTGTQLHETGSIKTPGRLVAGFLDYGYQADIQSGAQWPITMSISSPNANGTLTATNIGAVGLNNISPQAHLDVQGYPNTAETNLALRSGNSSGTTTSVQISFGYNGDASMRHAFVTQHSTGVYGNRLDMLVWGPGTGSTATIASLDVMALQAINSTSGGSVHAHPAGTPDVELEISDGLLTGGGTLHRFRALTPSSRKIKSDIEYLSEKDQAQALADVLALKPASFRFKSGGPLRKGLLYEDTPASIRGPGTSVLLTDRIVNLEMALKKEIARYEALQKHLTELEKDQR